MYLECISVRTSGKHRIRSRYNTCCANTNVSSPTKVALYRDTRYKHDTTQDTTKYRLSVMADTYPACIPPAMTHLRSFERLGRFPDGSSSATRAMRRRSACRPLGSRASRAGAMRRIRRGYEIFFVFQPYLEVSCATRGDTDERMYPVVSCRIPEYPRGARVGPCVRGWIRVS